MSCGDTDPLAISEKTLEHDPRALESSRPMARITLSPLARSLACQLERRQQSLAALYRGRRAELDAAIVELALAGLVEVQQTSDGRTVIGLARGAR